MTPYQVETVLALSFPGVTYLPQVNLIQTNYCATADRKTNWSYKPTTCCVILSYIVCLYGIDAAKQHCAVGHVLPQANLIYMCIGVKCAVRHALQQAEFIGKCECNDV